MPPDDLDPMLQGWVRLLARYGVAAADAHPVFDLLVAAHSAPDRHYHNLDHLRDVFRVAARLGTITDDPGPLHLAVWFHDAVYDPRAKDNEARSAALAADLLGPIGVPASVLERVARLVRLTAHADADRPPADRDALILLDADLAILGADPERYRRYAADIRREYAWVPDDEYRVGRAALLGRFLARPRLYRYDSMREEYEDQARANIRAELAELR